MKKSAPKKFFTITEAAKKLGITRAAVYEAIKTQRLPAKWGEVVQKIWLVSASAVKEYRVSVSHKRRGKKTKIV